MLAKDGAVKIADFGIARIARDSVSRLTSQQDSGTLLYMSPEQLLGKTSEASDIYSLGVVLYEMLSGDPPFQSGDIPYQIREVEPVPLDGISPQFNEIVLRCLKKKPERRFGSVRILREELDGSAEQGRIAEARPGVPELQRSVPVEQREQAEKSQQHALPGMVLIPAGYFMMGDDDRMYQGPRHRVWVDAFYLDIYVVMNRQYAEFLKATGHKPPPYWHLENRNAPDQPVVGVSWDDAVAYCAWAGKRLPTEAEWEKAARGGLEGNKYPWGDEPPIGRARFNEAWPVRPIRHASQPGKFAHNGYGLYDMAGNVWQWCADWMDTDYYKISPDRNPKGPSKDQYHAFRGGGAESPAHEITCSNRGLFPPSCSHLIGIRCAKTP